MRLATFIAPGSDVPTGGEVRGDVVVAFGDGSTVLDRLASGDSAPASGAEHPLSGVRLLAPVPRPPAIFCIGRNYGAHVEEMGHADAPTAPLVFLKLGLSSVAPNDPVRVPVAASAKLDYEAELVVVIGAGGTVAGYAVADDLSARDLQGAEPQWTRAKGFDSSCPWGPWITTADEVDASALGVRTWVNGEQRQDSTTANLIFGVDTLVSFIAETCTLEPGAIVLTGTPSGVGHAMDPPRYLAPGDVVRIEIDELGSIEHRIDY